MKRSTLLRKETFIPAFAVSLILVFAFVMPGNAFRSNGDEQCGYGYGYGQADNEDQVGYGADNEDQQGNNNDNQQGDESDQGCKVEKVDKPDKETGNTAGDDNLSGSDDKGDVAGDGKTGGTHVASLTKAPEVHHAKAAAPAPTHKDSGSGGDGDQHSGSGSGSGGGGHGD